ncbi:MAG: VWA domain-containing protein [Bdellovibrionaceae bacterium]|nr:VWA domain-containing protein [Pseudobdellovibrionaceae bacterium]
MFRKYAFLSLLIFINSTLAVAKAADQPVKIVKDSVNRKVTIHIDVEFTKGPQVDYLFLIDNSGSMYKYQQQWAKNSEILVDKLKSSFVDFHFGVISSDSTVRAGELLGEAKFITASTQDWPSKLKQNMNIGTEGNWTEVFFENTLLALTEPLVSGANHGFLRPSAKLSLIYITDGDQADGMKPLEFAYRLTSEVKALDQLEFNAFVLTESDRHSNSCLPDDSIRSGTAQNIIEAVRIIGRGKAYDLCSLDPEQQMFDFVESIVPSASTEYRPMEKIDNIELVGNVNLATLKVSHGTQVIPNDQVLGWSYESKSNSVVFSTDIAWEIQAEGTPININYELL